MIFFRQFQFCLFLFSNSCFPSWFVIIFFCFFSPAFFLSSIPSPPAYLDDEEDEDPFGDYVISKSHLTVVSHRHWTHFRPICLYVIVFDVLWCPLYVCDLLFYLLVDVFMKETVAHNAMASNWAPANSLQYFYSKVCSVLRYDCAYCCNNCDIHISMRKNILCYARC